MSQNLENIAENPNLSAPQIPAADTTPFISRFNQWMKAIAIIVLCTFIPDQISWAFGYNPAVLYRNLPSFAMQDASMPMPKPALQVAGSLGYLLKQIQDKPKLRLQLNLDPAANDSSGVPARSASPAQGGEATKQSHTLDIDTKTIFTVDKINKITQWLKAPNLNILNCGVYSLKDILEANGIKRSLSEISVMTLSVDIMADIMD